MKYLLDTNIISEIRKRDRADQNLAAWVRSVPARDLATSVLVLAEIRRGIELKRRSDPNQAANLDLWYERFRAGLSGRILGVDEAIAATWAHMSVPDPLPFVDGLLAATAKVRGLIFVTRNTTDVARTGVALLNPFQAQQG